jgi:hypothetical protein
MFPPIELNPLATREAIELLTNAGISEERATRINRIIRGHPLALTLAASTLVSRQEPTLEQVAINRVIDELTRMYVADIRDPLTRRTFEAASVVRRATISLLKAMLPDAAPRDAFERLSELSFVQTELDGLYPRFHPASHRRFQSRIPVDIKRTPRHGTSLFELAAASHTDFKVYRRHALSAENPTI